MSRRAAGRSAVSKKSCGDLTKAKTTLLHRVDSCQPKLTVTGWFQRFWTSNRERKTGCHTRLHQQEGKPQHFSYMNLWPATEKGNTCAAGSPAPQLRLLTNLPSTVTPERVTVFNLKQNIPIFQEKQFASQSCQTLLLRHLVASRGDTLWASQKDRNS